MKIHTLGITFREHGNVFEREVKIFFTDYFSFKMNLNKTIIFLLTYICLLLPESLQTSLATECVTFHTKLPNNPIVNIYYRVPKNYSPKSKKLYRVLAIFGGRNSTGEDAANGYLGFAQWADDNDIFLVGPGFKDDEYWQPAKWSGKILERALQEIAQKYKISTNRILYYGLSAGSQCSNLFAAWKPENCVAWVSHGCGVWHNPGPAMRKIPGLVTCGDADVNRYILSRKFTAQCRKLGINIIFKSFPNSPHNVPPESVVLAKSFLLYHHYRNIHDLIQSSFKSDVKKIPVLYIGDDQENKFWDISSREVDFIDPSDKVCFPTKELAEAWGKFEPTKWPKKKVITSGSINRNKTQHKYEHLIVNTSAGQNRNLEISIRVPECSPTETKENYLLVLFGGRNWPGDKTIDTYGFEKLADRYGIYLISPSFVNDDYWYPENWSGEALFTAINKIEQKYNLKNLKIFYYGYSAGGQCANLFYAWKPKVVSALGIHACGVWFNNVNPSWEKIPILITCGMEDKGRFSYSYSMVQSLREAGHPVIWRNYDAGGHELIPHALAIARQFFQEIISKYTDVKYVSEDFDDKILSADSDEAKRIDPELCNKFFSLKMATLWSNCNEAAE